MKVGDLVELEWNGETVYDTIAYIGNGYIEGEKYDLTYTKFTIIRICDELGI